MPTPAKLTAQDLSHPHLSQHPDFASWDTHRSFRGRALRQGYLESTEPSPAQPLQLAPGSVCSKLDSKGWLLIPVSPLLLHPELGKFWGAFSSGCAKNNKGLMEGYNWVQAGETDYNWCGSRTRHIAASGFLAHTDTTTLVAAPQKVLAPQWDLAASTEGHTETTIHLPQPRHCETPEGKAGLEISKGRSRRQGQGGQLGRERGVGARERAERQREGDVLSR